MRELAIGEGCVYEGFSKKAEIAGLFLGSGIPCVRHHGIHEEQGITVDVDGTIGRGKDTRSVHNQRNFIKVPAIAHEGSCSAGKATTFVNIERFDKRGILAVQFKEPP